jgi:GR25 family glycosyltransferase involved in LPS biosynthesis
MEQLFLQEHLHVARWPASTPSDGDVKRANFGDLSPGERGCAMSHYRIWQHMVNENMPVCVIFEDDIMFKRNWKHYVNGKLSTIDKTDPEWDLLYLHMYSPAKLPYHRWSKVKNQYCTTAYILSLRGAKFLVDEFKDTKVQSDWMLQKLQLRGHSEGYFPWLVLPKPTPSEIVRINQESTGVSRRTTDCQENDHMQRLGHLLQPDKNDYYGLGE